MTHRPRYIRVRSNGGRSEGQQYDILAIELYDSPENIYTRLVFSDGNDTVYVIACL